MTSCGPASRSGRVWNHDAGIIRRLILDWQLQPGQFGRSKVSIELVGREELPRDWYEHSAHHGEGRSVLRVTP